MSKTDKENPDCFGILKNVFPKTENGLRETPESCLLSCQMKTECLRTAITKSPDAATVQEERIDEAYDAGMLSFFERWSRKKNLNYKNSKKQKKGDKKS